MSDAQWALLIGFAIVTGTRMLDVLLPKGYMARWVSKYLVKNDDKGDDEA